MILSSNDQFKSMTLAQKSFVLSMFVNKVFQSPKSYGLSDDGVLRVGDKLDFTKLFGDIKEIKSIFDKAKETITPGSPQEKSILANNEKITSWVKENPNAELTNDRVSEILNSEPKKEKTIETIPTLPKLEPAEIKTPEATKSVVPEITSEPVVVPEAPAETPVVKSVSLETLDIDKGLIHQEIAKAKDRLAKLESSGKNPNLERSFASDSKSILSDSEFTQNVEAAFRSEINDIYGGRGLLGFGKVSGVDTKEWGEMARLQASKVVEYYTGDSAKSGLPNDIIEKLSKSKTHNVFMEQMANLMEQSNGAVKPLEDENMEQFIKRLGGYILKTHLQKAA